MTFDYQIKLDEAAFAARVKALMKRNDEVFNINNYVNDGFEKVCDVIAHYSEWMYKNINQDLMYSRHNSWVYFIVEDNIIVKCGETGNPLGIREQWGYYKFETQPVGNSKCRLGRLRKGDGTDSYIRSELRASIEAGIDVSIWVKKCNIHVLNESINGKSIQVATTIHKSVESAFLEYFKNEAGRLPILNKSSK